VTVIWLNDRLVDPRDARLSYDDPAVRDGDGVFDSMRAENGTVPLVDRHLARMARSVSALGMTGTPPTDAIRAAVQAVAARFPTGVAKIRATVSAYPTLLVEGAAVDPPALGSHRAITIRGAWLPDRWLAEHKTLSFLGWRVAQRTADAAGADTALLLDAGGRLGEATTANVFCVIDGELVTAPVHGLLPGTTRAQIIERTTVSEHAPTEAEWGRATEIFTASAIRRITAVVEVDGVAVGDGTPGPVTRAVAASFTGPA
jgi:branched-chain amino acid aminotransferase